MTFMFIYFYKNMENIQETHDNTVEERIPEKHQEEFKELTEDEVREMLRRKFATEPDKSEYLLNTLLLLCFLLVYYQEGAFPSDLFWSFLRIGTDYHNINRLSKYFNDDIINIIHKISKKIPERVNPIAYLDNYIISRFPKVDKTKLKLFPKRSFTQRNIRKSLEQINLPDNEQNAFLENDEIEAPQKIIINRARKKKITQNRINKRNIFNSKK